ncbi:hypothetical protein [Sporisorium scitamineum]|uniref:Uncharacterized protein n=1 Tax=Sporisorium scitamineum TaxID=49012 RepID=A0A0F7RT14_9BASI|nr:hypothetical protein [Sporisorium scitamineum]
MDELTQHIKDYNQSLNKSNWSIKGMGAMLMQEYDVYKDSSGWWQVDLEPQQDIHQDAQEDHKQQCKKVTFPIAYASCKLIPSET